MNKKYTNKVEWNTKLLFFFKQKYFAAANFETNILLKLALGINYNHYQNLKYLSPLSLSFSADIHFSHKIKRKW